MFDILLRFKNWRKTYRLRKTKRLLSGLIADEGIELDSIFDRSDLSRKLEQYAWRRMWEDEGWLKSRSNIDDLIKSLSEVKFIRNNPYLVLVNLMRRLKHDLLGTEESSLKEELVRSVSKNFGQKELLRLFRMWEEGENSPNTLKIAELVERIVRGKSDSEVPEDMRLVSALLTNLGYTNVHFLKSIVQGMDSLEFVNIYRELFKFRSEKECLMHLICDWAESSPRSGFEVISFLAKKHLEGMTNKQILGSLDGLKAVLESTGITPVDLGKIISKGYSKSELVDLFGDCSVGAERHSEKFALDYLKGIVSRHSSSFVERIRSDFDLGWEEVSRAYRKELKEQSEQLENRLYKDLLSKSPFDLSNRFDDEIVNRWIDDAFIEVLSGDSESRWKSLFDRLNRTKSVHCFAMKANEDGKLKVYGNKPSINRVVEGLSSESGKPNYLIIEHQDNAIRVDGPKIENLKYYALIQLLADLIEGFSRKDFLINVLRDIQKNDRWDELFTDSQMQRFFKRISNDNRKAFTDFVQKDEEIVEWLTFNKKFVRHWNNTERLYGLCRNSAGFLQSLIEDQNSMRKLANDQVAMNKLLSMSDDSDAQILAESIVEKIERDEDLQDFIINKSFVFQKFRDKINILSSGLQLPRSPCFIVSYPRSGSNFLQNILKRSVGFVNQSIYSPLSDDLSFALTLKSHAPTPKYLKQESENLIDYYRFENSKYIVLVRDPRDVAISFFEYVKVKRKVELKQTEFLNGVDFFYASTIDKQFSRKLNIAPMNVVQAYRMFIRNWIPFIERNPKQTVFLKYEELLSDPKSVGEEVLEHLGVKADINIEAFDEFVSQYSREDRPRGKAYGWRQLTSQYRDLIADVETKLKDEIILLDY